MYEMKDFTLLSLLSLLSLLALSACVGLSKGDTVEQKAITSNGTEITKVLSLPPNTSSEYLQTNTVALVFREHGGKLAGQYVISLSPKKSLPKGAYLEVLFENPANPDAPLIVPLDKGAELQADPFDVYLGTNVGNKTPGSPSITGKSSLGNKEILVISPEVANDLQCKYYLVAVNIYKDASKAELLSRHDQLLLGNIDTSLVRSIPELTEKLRNGKARCRANQ